MVIYTFISLQCTVYKNENLNDRELIFNPNMYTLFNKNQAAFYFVRPFQAVT